MKLRKDLTTNSIDKFIFMAAVILFVFLYSQNIDPSQKQKVNIFLTENEIIIQKLDMYYIQFKRKLHENPVISKEMLRSRDAGEGDFADLKGFIA